MTYHLEVLGDERFQQLCQSILVATVQNIQCLPVGQPDGGRDSFQRNHVQAGKSDFVIYQVKFFKDPASKESRDVVESLIKSEAAKVQRLIARGGSSYYLMTNVSGTSHLDTGSIDRVNDALTREFGIPTFCWWRDDIQRRIDGLAAVKWSFPEILKATDILAALIQPSSDADSKRRGDAIRAYLAHQAQQDAQLKFKQIDLHRSIVDLFVDLPAITIASPGSTEREHAARWAKLIEKSGVKPLTSSDDEHRGGEASVGILELMTKDVFVQDTRRLVVEGAPVKNGVRYIFHPAAVREALGQRHVS